MSERGKGLLQRGYKQTSVMLHPETRRYLDEMAHLHGVSQGAVLDAALRQLKRGLRVAADKSCIEHDINNQQVIRGSRG